LTQPANTTNQKRTAQKRSNTANQRINSAKLFAGNHTLTIEHEGQDYILRVTKSGKLILTK